MADHIITRAHRRLIDRAPPHHQLPDPFHGLSPYHRIRLLTLTPTWSERWRLCDPKLTTEAKRHLLIDILFERRRDFDHQMELRRQYAFTQRMEHFWNSGQAMPIPGDLLSSTALTDIVKQRQLQTDREQEIREAYYLRRRQREENMEDDHQPTRRRRPSR